MKRLWMCMFAIFFAISLCDVNVYAQKMEPLIRSEYAIAINLNDDRIMYEKNSEHKMYPASLTKIMTTIVAIENIEDLENTYVFEEKTLDGLWEEGAAVAGFKVGDKVTYEDLLYGVMLPSGADASRALALSLFGSEENFVDEMNAMAKSLKMKNTHFMNTSGLHDENHYTTVKDLSLLLRYALKNETFKTIFCSRYYLTHNKALTFYSTFDSYSSIIDVDTSIITGSKTGYTDPASLCLATLSEKNNEAYIVITGQTNSDASYPYHVEDALTLYRYLYNTYNRLTIMTADQIIATIPIKNGKEETYDVYAKEDITALIQHQDKIRFEWRGQKEIEAPDYSDSYIGTFYVYEDEKVILAKDYYLDYNIENKVGTFHLNISSILVWYAISFIVGMAVVWWRKKGKNNNYKKRTK